MTMQVRSGQVLEIEGRLLSVVKSFHSVGAGRQLGNVQVIYIPAIYLPNVIESQCEPLHYAPGQLGPNFADRCVL